MFSSTKKLSEEQLLDEIKIIIGKNVLKHSKVMESLFGEGKSSVFMTYVWIYTYLATQAIIRQFGLSTNTLVLEGRLEDMMINEASSSGHDEDSIIKLKVGHEKAYKSIADRFNKAIAKDEAHYDPLYMKVASKVAVSVLAENYSDKSLEDYANEIGAVNFKKLLTIVAQTHDFNNEVTKLLSKRKIA